MVGVSYMVCFVAYIGCLRVGCIALFGGLVVVVLLVIACCFLLVSCRGIGVYVVVGLGCLGVARYGLSWLLIVFDLSLVGVLLLVGFDLIALRCG